MTNDSENPFDIAAKANREVNKQRTKLQSLMIGGFYNRLLDNKWAGNAEVGLAAVMRIQMLTNIAAVPNINFEQTRKRLSAQISN